MSLEQLPSQSDGLNRQRLSYGAVPLDPWRATHPGTQSAYYPTSLDQIADKVDEATQRAIEDGWVDSPDVAQELHRFIGLSLTDAHTRRVMHNGDTRLESLSDDADSQIFEYAKDGLATPAELFSLLKLNLDLKSIELAKLSHPLDFGESNEMKAAIDEIVLREAQLVLDLPRFKRKRFDGDIPAAIIVRKLVLGIVEMQDGYIEIIERQSLLVRGDLEAIAEGPHAYIDRLIRNCERRLELESMIEDELDNSDAGQSSVWLQPTTTSYYAKYIAHKNDSESIEESVSVSQPEYLEYPA